MRGAPRHSGIKENFIFTGEARTETTSSRFRPAPMRIAVITPAYNAAPFIAVAIRSVLAQSHRDWRMVVVDDGSTDDTAVAVARFAEPRLTLIRQPNAGVSAARNCGMAAATGDALLFLDADDWLAPEALAVLADALQAAPEAVAAVGAWATVNGDGQRPRPSRYRPWPTPTDLLPSLLVRNQFANGGHLLIRATAAHRAGGFRADIVYGEDWEYFIRLAALGPFAFVPTATPLLFVRSRADGAYRRLAADPRAFAPCMAAIFANPRLADRLGTARVPVLRRRAEAENAWIVGRELVRQGRRQQGRRWLVRSVGAAPSPRRVALLAAAHLLPLLPTDWHGPFRAYPPDGAASAPPAA